MYRMESRLLPKKQQKSTWELEEQATKTYNMRVLLQQNLELNMNFPARS